MRSGETKLRSRIGVMMLQGILGEVFGCYVDTIARPENAGSRVLASARA